MQTAYRTEGLVNQAGLRYSPPPYEKYDISHERSRWNPNGWSRGLRIIVIIAVLIVVLVIIIGAVVGAKANTYPHYIPLIYRLEDTYHGVDFFDNFDYFTGYDPASGFVHYVPRETAMSEQYNLTYASQDSAVLRVDTSEAHASTGRFSVRITSKKQYSSGLFVFDVFNTPYGCSTWPALWLSDPSDWPDNGEIDVVESVNQADSGNQMTLHTSNNCNMDVKRKQTSNTISKSCWNETDNNAGCGVKGPQDTIGESFNANGGGIYAVEWRDAGIRMWFFDRTSIPNDIFTDPSNNTAPDPSTWARPLADFPSTNCDISSHFKNQSIIADIDLCGQWAGNKATYNTQDSCPGSCTDFVANNAAAFEKAYWEFGSFRVYTATD